MDMSVPNCFICREYALYVCGICDTPLCEVCVDRDCMYCYYKNLLPRSRLISCSDNMNPIYTYIIIIIILAILIIL